MLLAWPSKPSPSHVPYIGLVWFGVMVCYALFVIVDMLET